MSNGTRKATAKPALEWVAAAIGLLLSLAIFGFVGWQAVTAPERQPAMVVVEPGPVTPFPGGWVVEVTARNLSPKTAAAVQIEGTLRRGGSETKATAMLDYVPGNSTRRGGLFLPEDPGSGTLEVRALGYSSP